jgi:hypothetical protein
MKVSNIKLRDNRLIVEDLARVNFLVVCFCSDRGTKIAHVTGWKEVKQEVSNEFHPAGN